MSYVRVQQMKKRLYKLFSRKYFISNKFRISGSDEGKMMLRSHEREYGTWMYSRMFALFELEPTKSSYGENLIKTKHYNRSHWWNFSRFLGNGKSLRELALIHKTHLWTDEWIANEVIAYEYNMPIIHCVTWNVSARIFNDMQSLTTRSALRFG